MKIASVLIITGTSFSGIGQTTNQFQSDVKSTFQLIVDLPELQQYYHVGADTSGRQLIFQEFDQVDQNSLTGVTKFGRQLVVLSGNQIKENEIKCYFVVDDFNYNENSLKLRLSYVGEGLMISCEFKKHTGIWYITDSKLVEK